MFQRPTLSAHALTSLEAARAHVDRMDKSTDATDDVLVKAINWATAQLERATGRRLKSRNYDDSFTLTCTWTSGSTYPQPMTATGGATAARVGDELAAVGLARGSQVYSVTNATTLTADRLATASKTGVAVTVGSAPLVFSGAILEPTVLLLPQRPVEAVWAASYVDSSGTETALDITDAQLEPLTGTYQLANDSVPLGRNNLQVQCKAGYRAATEADAGFYADEYELLEGACLWLAQAYFQDQATHVGRGMSVNAGAGVMTITDLKLPANVREVVNLFKRLW